jgi:DNA-directed RNA polymerase specialized sigma subunit
MVISPNVVNGVLARARECMTIWQYQVFEEEFQNRLTAKQIAERYGRSESAVYKTLARAKARLKKRGYG